MQQRLSNVKKNLIIKPKLKKKWGKKRENPKPQQAYLSAMDPMACQ